MSRVALVLVLGLTFALCAPLGAQKADGWDHEHHFAAGARRTWVRGSCGGGVATDCLTSAAATGAAFSYGDRLGTRLLLGGTIGYDRYENGPSLDVLSFGLLAQYQLPQRVFVRGVLETDQMEYRVPGKGKAAPVSAPYSPRVAIGWTLPVRRQRFPWELAVVPTVEYVRYHGVRFRSPAGSSSGAFDTGTLRLGGPSLGVAISAAWQPH